MEIIKKKLADLPRCYAAAHMNCKDGVKVILASESHVGVGMPCYSYQGEDFETRETLWENSGGTMSLVQVPGKDNEIVALQDFYLKQTPSESKIVWGVYEDGKWTFKKIIQMEYIHRFTLATTETGLYIILATIADKKDFKEDWSRPGSIYAGKIEDFKKPIELVKIKSDLFRNHGFCHDTRDNHNEIYFGSDQGIDKLYLKGDIKDWKFERIYHNPTGEIAIGDLDGDGIDEIITIEAFHGNKIRIYDQKNKELNLVYEYDNEIDFAHALIYTTLRGVPSFVCGVRRVESELFYIQYIDGKYVPTIIEKGIGPANLDAINLEDKDIIISANHSKDEAAIYIVR